MTSLGTFAQQVAGVTPENAARLNRRGTTDDVLVYVAGSSRELPRALRAQAMLREIPHCRLSHDWVAPIQANLARGVTDADLPIDTRRAHAVAGLAAIERSDVLWLLLPESQTTGAWVEFGAALAMRGPSTLVNPWNVIVSGVGPRPLFTTLADVDFETDAFAAEWIARLVKVRRAV